MIFRNYLADSSQPLKMTAFSRQDSYKIDCSRFSDFNYDLLVFAVFHELGHINATKDHENNADVKNMCNFTREFDAWRFAITNFNRTFGRNISIKMARYMMTCLNSYLPDYNSYESSDYGKIEQESNFWCPLKMRIFR